MRPPHARPDPRCYPTVEPPRDTLAETLIGAAFLVMVFLAAILWMQAW